MSTSKRVYFSTTRTLNRRHFLRGAGAAVVGLPFLDAMVPAFQSSARASAASQQATPRRFVALCATLGFHTPFLFPSKEGSLDGSTPYLNQMQDHLDHLTVISGLAHPEQQGNNGHASELTWLTSAQRPGLAGFKNTISIDQLMAEKVGLETRFPSLVLSTSGRSMSWNSNGVEIPGETRPSNVFKALFVNGSSAEVQRELKQLDRGQSILDTVKGDAEKLNSKLGIQDQRKLDEYFTAIRELEVRLNQSKSWATRPKPEVDAKAPVDISDRADAIGRQNLMYDMLVLALQSDSTRTATFQLSGMNAVPAIDGVSTDWHQLSHHGKDPEKIDELKIIEQAEFAAFNRFLAKMKDVVETESTLLDRTTILYGSNLGNASSHSPRNLPVMIAGGGFQHGNYVAHDDVDNTPFANLFVTFAQQMGLDIDTFGSSTATGVRGLEQRNS
ncbi:DUF1552 domain-containing protein [Thalassoglobus sp. JC818]|uniref:DUF1552 domain-containing protein n=1 Tax=Thalassoglobus sp. JC818 TaxID=3232136 RepID=UPI003459FDD3